MNTVKILVTGCLHGEWEKLVNTIDEVEQAQGAKPDLIIVLGDSQTMRTEADLDSFACPPKFRLMHTFYKLYNGEIKMPVPTIVVGGNHEAMDWLYLLPFGGWLAPNVFYTGRANSLIFGDITISSISGLYNRPDQYFRPVNEKYPIRSNDIQSSYHIRAFSDFQLLGLSNTQIMVSHDWPSGTPSKFGGKYLEKVKSSLIESDHKGTFGLCKGMNYINKLRPLAYFAAHHHIEFSTTINGCSFMALPKPPKKNWCVLMEFNGTPGELKYRGEWISILKATSAEMANPEILKTINWDERWKELKPTLEKCPDQPLGEYQIDPIKYTADFCRRNGIYCPNETIRPQI